MRYRILYLCIFTALIVLIGLLGYYFNRYLWDKQKKEVYSSLTNLTQLKIQTITNWRTERKSEAEFLHSNKYLHELVTSYLNGPDQKKSGVLREFFRPFILKPDYTDVILITGPNKYISFFNDSIRILSPEINKGIEKCFRDKKVILTGLHQDAGNTVCMESLIPIIEKNNVISVLMLKIDPAQELFPLISSKPVLRKTIETFIVRAEGDSVVFLNKLRHKENPGSFFKLPISTPNLPAAKAVKGYRGKYEGIDYAGNEVLADLNKIPDSPWYIVTKLNLDEVYAPIRDHLRYILAGAFLLMVISGLLIYSIRKEQKIIYLNRQLELEKETRSIIKKAESALLESESKLLDAQELAHLGSWDLNLLTNELTWTDEVYRIFGLTPQEFKATYEAFLEGIHPDDREEVNNTYLNSVNEGRDSYEIEHRIILKHTGEVRYVHEKCKHTRDESGKIIRSIGMVQDITERVKSREALLNSEERFSKAFSANPNAMFISLVEDDTIVEMNDTFLKLYGYTKDEVLGKTSEELQIFVNPEDSEKAKTLLFSNGYLHNFEVRQRLKNGEERIVLLSVELLQMSMGKSTLTIIQDVTESKYNEAALRESEAKLMEAQHLASLGSYTLNLKTRTAEWSDETYRIFEREKSGKPLLIEEVYSYVHPGDVAKIKLIFEELLTSPRIMEYEFRIVAPDGIKYIYTYSKPYVNKNGKVDRIFGTMMDITQRKQAQLRLEATLRELMRSNKDLEEFAYTASHDLQEPIRMIKSYAQLFEMKYKGILEESGKQYLSFIFEGASRMQQLVDDLLKYSRVSTTKKEYKIIDCNAIVKDVLKDLKFRIEDEKASVEVDDLPSIKGDETQLRQLFQNFLHNALKFRREDPPEIRIACEQRNAYWLFSIADNGIGIEQKFFERIFVIFQRLHERDKYPGTGIGLALCKKIVERHGGQVCVESILDRGTIFYFTLPVNGY